MSQFVAFIRGVNVGGKNKVSMRDLSHHLGVAGLRNVTTYINSGNVIFESDEAKLESLVLLIETILRAQFGVVTRVSVISSLELRKSIKNAPAWWGNDSESKHNAIFVIAPADGKAVEREVGKARYDYEKVQVGKHVIFWSAPIKTFSRTRWSKIVSTKAYDWVTIRNSNTANKVVELTS